MVWARAALVGGLLLVVVAFAVGTEVERSTVVSGRTHSCGPSIPASWLVSGTPDPTTPGPTSTADERRVASACNVVMRASGLSILLATVLGALLAVVGWTGLARRRESAAPPVAFVDAGQ
ncbi:hypothetical protein SAMN05192575_10654 [Nocardioides alpinus]|uniref:Uncharacterized protein n=1 Tax=Nocardioides alpinus TaxID=748909 RepID=A0A1I0ZQ59_9ACTN|nr:hypothetical protein [Nocardioides alpinus]PKH41949.1 hypothetical protein CXG46_08875 [Nocardioides alpinus]SFB26498.1 hypothetical protein SAMN05192575_10654 [Nocardioides alpinus]